VPNLVCVQQFNASCEELEGNIDIERCGKRMHSFWDEPVGTWQTYQCEPAPGPIKIVAIAHNAKAFVKHFILNREIMLKWKAKIMKD